MSPKKLPLLENLRIATPCNADWDEMAGNDQVRFCGQCEKNVYNLSAMTRSEAESLVGAREGRLCVRLFQRPDGTVLTSDCPVGVRRERLRQRVWASLSGAVASMMLVFGVWSGRARADLTLKDGKKQPPHVAVAMMGGPVAMPSPAPKHVLMGKPSMPHPIVKKPAAAMMGDIAE